MASDAPCMALTLVKEDRLYLVLEKLVIQRRRSCLAVRLPQRPARRQQQTRRDGHIRRGPPNVAHRNLPIFMVEKRTLCSCECLSSCCCDSVSHAAVSDQTMQSERPPEVDDASPLR